MDFHGRKPSHARAGRKAVEGKRGHINTALKQIARQLEIDINLTFYVARHTMATTLKRKQVSTDVIKEVMGHQDIKTTQIYLAKFGSEVINKAGELL